MGTKKKGRRRLPDVPYQEPTEEERERGNVLTCHDCEREWPLRFCAIAVGRCVNCARAWWRKDKEERRGHYWRLYGLSETDAAEKLAAQHGVCRICDTEIFLDRNPRAQLDHCHETGHPRDFLCARCNRGIGVFGDSTKLVTEAARYLARHFVPNSINNSYKRPRRPRALKGVPVRTRKPHHILTASGKRVNISDPDIREQMAKDVEIHDAVDAYIRHKVSFGK